MSTRRKSRGYVAAKQVEAFQGEDLGFRLIQEEAPDPERLAREQSEREAAQRQLQEHPSLF